MSDSPTESSEQNWECDWEDHRLAQLRRMAKLPLAVKIAWLEEAHKMVMYMQASRERQAREKQEKS